MELTKYGLFTSPRVVVQEQLADAAKLAEQLGFGAFWRGGSQEPAALEPALAATDRLVCATGIVNVWSTPAEVAARQDAQLRERFGAERFLLGVGIGHREATAEYKRPLGVMTEYLDGLDAASPPVLPEHRCIAALGPKMLDLSRERTLGTHPYFVDVAHTRATRERLGAGPLIALSIACVLDPDDDSARAAAREYASVYLGLSNYTNNLLRHGYDESDIADGGSDRLIDAIVPHGTADHVATAVQAHLDAGADHVCLQVVGVPEGIPGQQWKHLAAALGL